MMHIRSIILALSFRFTFNVHARFCVTKLTALTLTKLMAVIMHFACEFYDVNVFTDR